jgi:hypothetical protein
MARILLCELTFMTFEITTVTAGKIMIHVHYVRELWYFIFIYHHPPHRMNVTAPHGRPNLRSRLHFGQNQEGRPQSP